MSDQFISVITDEAMSRVCYDAGWTFTPYRFLVSETDVLADWDESAIFDSDGNVTTEVYTYLKSLTTSDMQTDYNNGNVWYTAKFSSITQATETALTHHLNIPGDTSIDSSSKNIKTIYFVYQDAYGQEFLYALARSNTSLLFEKGITQSFFFNFTVTNSATQELTDFILNYSCAHEIEDHNVTEGDNIHSFLVARDGSRTITGQLLYDGVTITNDNALITKAYLDDISGELSTSIDLYARPIGQPILRLSNTLYSDEVRLEGAVVSRTTYANLYAIYGTTYGSGDGSTTFGLPNFLNRAIWGASSFGYLSAGLPNIIGTFSGHENNASGPFSASSSSEWHGNRNNNGHKRKITFNAGNYNSIYGSSSTVQPPAIKVRVVTRYK